MKCSNIVDMIAIRGISSLFSRKAFNHLLEYNDSSYMIKLLQYYGLSDLLDLSVSAVLKKTYTMLSKDYRCEYVYKNESLNEYILKKYGN